MKVHPTPLAGLLRIEPDVFRDSRGFFLETYREARYRGAGIGEHWVQDNVSRSLRGVLRGLHFQCVPHAQAKLVGVLSGEVFDVAVDLRVGSPTFGRWFGAHLSGEDCQQLLIPAGFAHGFCTLSDQALLAYKCSAPYTPEAERTLHWRDPALAIEWPISEPQVSPKDAQGIALSELDLAGLPRYAS